MALLGGKARTGDFAHWWEWGRGAPGQACSLYVVKVGWVQGSRIKGRLSWSAYPLVGAVCRVCAQFPAFVPDSLEVVVGFLVFLCLVHNLPQLPMREVIFLVPYGFFVFCCWRRLLSRCKHCSKGSQVSRPSLSQICRPDYMFMLGIVLNNKESTWPC